MSDLVVLFREIHRLRRYARDLQDQLDRIPRQVKIHQGKVAHQEGQLRDAQEAIRKLQVGVREKEGTLKSTHGQVAKYKKQLDDVGGKKEYDALQVEIANARAKCSQLEDEILNAITESEERTAALPELEKGLAQTREELARYEKESATRKVDLSTQLSQARAQLKEVEVQVPQGLREQYNRIVGARDAEGLAAVREGDCSACHTEIPRQTLSNLQQGQFVVCRSCGRILYLPEEERRESVDEE
jgi:predicted  nucleic acid-binding Zn-ribbon protein